MGFHPSLLMFVLVLSLLCTPAFAGPPLCLSCHTGKCLHGEGCVGCHHGNPATKRPGLAHHGLIQGKFARFRLPGSTASVRGGKLIESSACRRCHILGKRGNTLAANLDHLPAGREPRMIAAALGKPALFMPDFRFDEGQTVDLVNALLAGAEKEADEREQPVVVHFAQGKKGSETVFVKKCAPCHKALTERHGGLGIGGSGPNLSGLLSPFYPPTFREGQGWNIKRLRQWLENPRRIRSHSRMQPVLLTDAERTDLVETLMVSRRKSPDARR